MICVVISCAKTIYNCEEEMCPIDSRSHRLNIEKTFKNTRKDSTDVILRHNLVEMMSLML